MHERPASDPPDQQSIAWADVPEPADVPPSWSRVLLDSSTQTRETTRGVGSWVVERITANRYLRLFLSEQQPASFDALQGVGGASLLVEVFSDPADLDGGRSGIPLVGVYWDWVREELAVQLPAGVPGVADELVAVRVRGAGRAEPHALQLRSSSIQPYLDGREKLLAAHPSW